MMLLLMLLGLKLQLLQHAEAFDCRWRGLGFDWGGHGLLGERRGRLFDIVLMVKGRRGKEEAENETIEACTLLLFHPKRLPMKSIRTLACSVIDEDDEGTVIDWRGAIL